MYWVLHFAIYTDRYGQLHTLSLALVYMPLVWSYVDIHKEFAQGAIKFIKLLQIVYK